MRKFARAFLRNPNPNLRSHAFTVKRDAGSVLSFNTFATGASREDGELGASKHTNISVGALETVKMEKKSRRPKADKIACFEQDLGGTERSLHVEISTVKVKTRGKTRLKTGEKAKKKANANAQDLNHMVAGEKVQELTEIRVANAGKCKTEVGVVNAENVPVFDYEKEEQNAVAGEAEEMALHAKAKANMIHIQEEFSKYAAKLELNTYKCGRQWEETAHKLLDYGIPFTHVIKMLQKCKNLACTRHCGDSTLLHLTALSMSHEEMGRAISQWPTILNTSNTMFQRKVDFFESVGIDRHTLGKMICSTPLVIITPLIVLRQNFTFWEDYMQGVQANAACIMISKYPRLLTYNLQKTVKPKIAFLEEQGIDKWVLFKHSQLLGLSMEAFVLKAKWLEQFGMSNPRKRAWGLAALYSISIRNLQARFNNFLAAGFSLDQVHNIILKSPQLLSITEDHFNLKLSYAVNVMNSSLDTLVACPAYWTHNFETKIKYRYEVIKELQTLGALQKELSPGYMVCMTNAVFTKRFVERLQDCVQHLDAPGV